MSYYVLDPNGGPNAQLQEVDDEAPWQCSRVVEHWEYWLYPRTQAALPPPSNRWGLIWDKTFGQAEAELNNGQQCELALARFFHKPPDSEENTYFNPLGPIACLPLNSTNPSIEAGANKVQQIMLGWNEAQTLVTDLVNSFTGDLLAPAHPLLTNLANAMQTGLRTLQQISQTLNSSSPPNLSALDESLKAIQQLDRHREDIVSRINAMDLGGATVATPLQSQRVRWTGETWNGPMGPGSTQQYNDHGTTFEAVINPQTSVLSVVQVCQRFCQRTDADWRVESTIYIRDIQELWRDKGGRDTPYRRYMNIGVLRGASTQTRYRGGTVETLAAQQFRICLIVLNDDDDFNSLKAAIEAVQRGTFQAAPAAPRVSAEQKQAMQQALSTATNRNILRASTRSTNFPASATPLDTSSAMAAQSIAALAANVRSLSLTSPIAPHPDAGLQRVSGQWNGQGHKTYTNGDEYEGNWAGGERCGQGKLKYANGDVYEGNFASDQRCGPGQMIYRDGRVQSGVWVYDQFITPETALPSGNNSGTITRTITRDGITVHVSSVTEHHSSATVTSQQSRSSPVAEVSGTAPVAVVRSVPPALAVTPVVRPSHGAAEAPRPTTSHRTALPTVEVQKPATARSTAASAPVAATATAGGTSVAQRIAAYQALMDAKR